MLEGPVGEGSADAAPPPAGVAAARRLAKTALLLSVLAVVVVGGPLVDAALRVPAGPPLDLAPGVRLAPLSGWRLASAQRDGRPALLTRGSASLAVLSVPAGGPGAGGPVALAARYLRARLEPASANLMVGDAEPLLLGGGRLVGARVAYRGDFDGLGRDGALVGEVTAVVSPHGTGVVFDAWALPDIYDYERDDVRAMLERAQVR
jgi:hypothetical protein